jgi:hypothetical protein
MVTDGLTADAACDLLWFHSPTCNVRRRAIAAGLTTFVVHQPNQQQGVTQLRIDGR